VVLVARREAALHDVATALQAAHGVETLVVALDLVEVDAATRVVDAVGERELGLLVLNAGFAATGRFLADAPSRQLAMVQLHCASPVALAHALLPPMVARGRGGAVVISSVMSRGGAAGWAVYNATKSFGLLFAEGLAAELEPVGLDVQAILPGGTRTAFVSKAGLTPPPWIDALMGDPEAVARTSLRTLGRRRVVVVGWLNRFNYHVLGLLPRSWSVGILGWLVRVMRR